MPANLSTHEQIGAVMTVSGNTPYTGAIAELAAQTFKTGVPLQLTTGFVALWNGTTVTAGILGFSLQPGANLSSNGKGAPGPFLPVGPPGAIQTYGSVIYQPSAVNIAEGAPMTDGRTYFEGANDDTIFEGQYDNSAGTVPADYTPTQASIGAIAGLTVDANGTWYVDASKTTVGTNATVRIIGINPIDGFIINARVRFQVLSASQQVF